MRKLIIEYNIITVKYMKITRPVSLYFIKNKFRKNLKYQIKGTANHLYTKLLGTL